jgi:hypothetical protein
MSYFENAVMTISEIGGHVDHTLPVHQQDDDDRRKRIGGAADDLCDWVYEHLVEDEGRLGPFKQEHLPRIARMVAIGMMAQFEYDLKREGELIAELMKKDAA